MSKPYTEAQFSDQIVNDRNWRLKEISDLKVAILKADPPLGRVLLRSLTAICYAHWEGYVRFTARKYLEYVSMRKLQFDELDRQFLKNYLIPKLTSMAFTTRSVKERCDLLDDILISSNQRFSRFHVDLVNTRANLNFEVFTDICLVCSVPIEYFEGKLIFIDQILLKRRNEIAHGEDTFIAMSDLDQIADETISLMRHFGDELENHVYLKRYRRA